MVSLEKFSDELFDAIYEKYLDENDPLLTKADWENLFIGPKDSPATHSGYVLVDREEIVGVLGMLISERRIGVEMKRFCNLHNWYVDREHRGKSLLLMRPAIKLYDHTITDFTPTPRVCRISQRLGFEELDSTLRVLLPFAGRLPKTAGCIELVDDPVIVRDHLSQSDQRIFDFHQNRHCQHFLIDANGRFCYLVCTSVQRFKIPYKHILYVSDKQVFRNSLPMIRQRLLTNSPSRFLVIDDRTVKKLRIPLSFRIPIRSRQLSRRGGVECAEIDGLYSELALLGLSSMPSIGYKIRCLAKWLKMGWVFRNNQTTLELDD